MRRISVKAATHAPGCDECAAEFVPILNGAMLQASFRPVADFGHCEILGYIASVRGPAGMLHGSFGRLARIAQQLGLLREFTCATVEAVVRRFMENQGRGLLFVPIPEGAIETCGSTLPDAICGIVDARVGILDRLVLLIPGIDPEAFPAAVDWLRDIRACGFRIAARTFGCPLAEQQLWTQVTPDYVLLDEQMFDGIDLATVPSNGFAAKLAAEMLKERRVVADGIGSSNDFNARVANKLLQHLSSPFEFDGQEIFVTVSIGIAVHPHDGATAEELIHAADNAMDRAKQQGGNACQFNTLDLDSDARRQLELERGLRHAIERDELFLDYQPQFDLKSGRVAGVEALLRWRHPELGLVSPASFIPVAEGSGLITSIGAWVLHTACMQLRAWDAAGLPPLRMAVNVSARQFHTDEFKAEVKRALRESAIPPARLELELTESLLVRNVPGAIEAMRSLKALGVRLSIDDFGTGYSGLSYLVDLPVDTLKIDQSFVRRLDENQNYGAIVVAIGELAHGLDLTVIAEGVESETQLEFLRSVYCDEVQGFLLARPTSPDGVEKLLNRA